MEKTVQAVYENGVLHLLEPLQLGERQVTVTISDRIDMSPESFAVGFSGRVGACRRER